MSELLACPFCGGRAEQASHGMVFYGVECQQCEARIFPQVTSAEAATQAWNRRAHPPTDSAALRDAAIAELVRRKMTSGNSVPVERCIITAAEIAAIAQQEADHE